MEALLPIDQAVWLYVLLGRDCTTDLTVASLVTGSGRAIFLLAVGAGCCTCGDAVRRRSGPTPPCLGWGRSPMA